jgi:hypothetical protein
MEGMPIIFSYTRAQALKDGVLVDLTDWARELGFRFPVACTQALWDGLVVPPASAPEQSERGRAHDLLWMLACSVRKNGGSQLRFQVLFQGTRSQPKRRVQQDLKAVCGPGDLGEPVLTVMLPEED